MDIFEQQKKLYADPHFGHEKRSLLEKLFGTVKDALTPSAVRGAEAHSFELHMIDQPSGKQCPETGTETYLIFRNGVHHETLQVNECACEVEVIALKKKFPYDEWTFIAASAVQVEPKSAVA